MRSVLDNSSTAEEPSDTNFQQTREWFRDERAKRVSDIIVGRIDEFQVRKDSNDFFERNEGQYCDKFQHDIYGGRLSELGIEAYATYLPIHFFFDENRLDDAADWGIYISEQGVMNLAAILRRCCHEQFGVPPQDKDYVFVEAAYQILLRHELEHFKIESFALNAEMFLGKAIYTPYLTNIYAETYYTDGCLEEALANATVLNSTVIKNLFDKELYPSADEKKRRVPWQVIVMEEFFDHQPAGYRNYSLTSGWPYEKDTHLHFDYRRRAMNFLCNQIVSGKVNPPKDEIPFYAFLPDNHFLRAENLVPIHIVKSLSDDESFIHVATPKRKVWERFLNGLGYVPTKRGSGDHVVWSRPGLPDLTINYHGDVLDFNSFKSSLKNLGININAFRNYQNTGRLPPVLLERLQAAKIVAG